MKVSALITGYNEQEEIKPLFDSLKGIEDIVFIDHESIDETGILAHKYGARVYRYATPVEVIKDLHREKFIKEFGIKPEFKVGDEVWDSGREKNSMAARAKNDWILLISCDERLTWNYKELEKELGKADQILHRFVHSHKPNGSPDYQFNVVRLYNRKVCKWSNGIHEVIVGGRQIFSNHIKLDHYQKPREYRQQYLPMLEYFALKYGETRLKYYLAREYYYRHIYDKAITMFDLYLQKATWNPEIQLAMTYKADCLWNLNRGKEARDVCLQAIAIDPSQKAPLEQMARMTFQKDATVWSKFASILKNEVKYL